jgi:hypothetical protein
MPKITKITKITKKIHKESRKMTEIALKESQKTVRVEDVENIESVKRKIAELSTKETDKISISELIAEFTKTTSVMDKLKLLEVLEDHPQTTQRIYNLINYFYMQCEGEFEEWIFDKLIRDVLDDLACTPGSQKKRRIASAAEMWVEVGNGTMTNATCEMRCKCGETLYTEKFKLIDYDTMDKITLWKKAKESERI